MLQSRKPAGIAFTRVKIQHQGRLVIPIHVKLHMADGHIGPKISSQSVQGWESQKYQKIPLFGKGRPRGRPFTKNSLTDF